MKKLSLTTIALTLILGFSSCTQEDTVLESTAQDLLKSFDLNKNSRGEFALDYQLNSGASSENIKDKITNTNNIYLYSSDYQSQSRVNQGLALENGKLQVSFNDTEKDEKHTITVLDDGIKTSKDENEYLESYGISGNGDGTYDLNFKVVDGIAVDFIYDGDRDVYEVHLTQDTGASQSDFVQTFTKEDGVALNIEFLNYLSSGTSKEEASSVLSKKPIIIMD